MHFFSFLSISLQLHTHSRDTKATLAPLMPASRAAEAAERLPLFMSLNDCFRCKGKQKHTGIFDDDLPFFGDRISILAYLKLVPPALFAEFNS